MTAYIRSREDQDELVLFIDGEDHSAWNLKACTLVVGKHNYIDYGVAQLMVNLAYEAGKAKGGKQLAAIQAILKT